MYKIIKKNSCVHFEKQYCLKLVKNINPRLSHVYNLYDISIEDRCTEDIFQYFSCHIVTNFKIILKSV